ncbi:MAG: carboxypeptidase regulatory-like domain-containing protein, partial [Candidatus Aminicenantes bacterium]|nr:carboxypeptidase regulatory-like domain-containing protein [Candidatus Aminicenantes bacterium]
MRKSLVILFMLMLSISLVAQQRTGNIFGRVTDLEGNPLPGVTVTLLSPFGPPMTSVTSVEGIFRFLSLSPSREYTVKLELTGFKTRIEENIVVTVGTNTNLSLTMDVGVLEEQVTVVAVSPMVDTKKTTVGQNVTQEALQSLPSARDPWVILQMAPSIVVDRENIGGNESGQQSGFFAKGLPSGAQNVWALDGIVISDPSAIGASPTYYDFDAFEEMQISVSGSDVTVQTGGIALNMVTRRGTNRLSLGGRLYFTDEKFQSSNLTENLIKEGVKATNKIANIKDFGFNVGGPIIRDRLWGIMTFGSQDIKTFNIVPMRDDTLLTNFTFKLNAQPIAQNRFEAMFFAGNKEKWGRDSS